MYRCRKRSNRTNVQVLVCVKNDVCGSVVENSDRTLYLTNALCCTYVTGCLDFICLHLCISEKGKSCVCLKITHIKLKRLCFK